MADSIYIRNSDTGSMMLLDLATGEMKDVEETDEMKIPETEAVKKTKTETETETQSVKRRMSRRINESFGTVRTPLSVLSVNRRA